MIADPFEVLSVEEADIVARELTTDRMHVRVKGSLVILYKDGQNLTVRLLPYQLTAHEIERVVAENDPWPEY
jgi:hypothetical protein